MNQNPFEQTVQMRAYELALKIGARILTYGRSVNLEIDRFYAGDKISELLAHACEGTLVVTDTLNAHIFRVAGLLDVPAICLVNNHVPEQEMLNASVESGTILMVSPMDMMETIACLDRCLGESARIAHENRI